MTQQAAQLTLRLLSDFQPQLQIEYGIALGVGSSRPRLSWVLPRAAAWVQSSYEVAVRPEDGEATSHVVTSPESVLVPWPAIPLRSRQRRLVRVRACGPGGRPTAWSEEVAVEAALLDPGDWTARAIRADLPIDGEEPRPATLFRHEFSLPPGVERARLYITAHGVYTAEVNGQPASDHVLPPGWSAYRRRLRYRVLDVTALVGPGPNAIGMTVADGWYCGFLGGGERRDCYGPRTAALAQLEVTLADGQRVTVATSPEWRAARGPVRSADLYMGEDYDARLEAAMAGWSRPGFDDRDWTTCSPEDRDPGTLVAADSPPVRRTQRVEPVAIESRRNGGAIVDFGQNLVGRVELRGLSAPAGHRIEIRHAEVLEDGELCTAPLRAARSTDLYRAAGREEPESWEPSFTFHGFRYAEVSGWPRALEPADVTAVVCHSDMTRTGWFTCSDPLLNRLHENVVWSMRGNFLDIPTDCPQRDERLGWTGDIQVFAPTGTFLFDCAGFLSSWLADLAADQLPDGGIPFVVPFPLTADRATSGTAAAWADAATVVPWTVYRRFGDAGILERQYPSMARHVTACIEAHGPELNPDLFQFGDWLDPAAPPDRADAGRTEPLLVAGAYLVHSADIMAAAAGVLDRAQDREHWEGVAAAYRAVWRDRFGRGGARLSSDSPTAYALAVCFQLMDSSEALAAAGRRLRELCEEAGHRIATGFVGTPLVCDALTATGHLDTAYALLLERDCPSFLYPVLHGATTIWERWDSLRPDGRVNTPSMTSFNHYALGAVADWMHRTVAGLAPLEPGYRTLLVQPRPGGGLSEVDAAHITPYGRAAIEWSMDGDRWRCRLTVPSGATAIADLPLAGWEPARLPAGTHEFDGLFSIPARPPRHLPSGAYWSSAVTP